MNITPLIPDGYNGPIKQLTCSLCRHVFYITHADYEKMGPVLYCHECSRSLFAEIEKAESAPLRFRGKNEPVFHSQPSPASFSSQMPTLPKTSSPVNPPPAIPRPRTIDREKM